MASESFFKKMKNAFYFTLKALFVLKIFQFLSWLFGHVRKRLDKKDYVNFKIYDVTTWLTNLWINILKLFIFCFSCLPSWGLSKVMEIKLQTICFYLIKTFLFLYFFISKTSLFLLLYSLTWPNFNFWLPLLREILGNVCIVIVC